MKEDAREAEGARYAMGTILRVRVRAADPQSAARGRDAIFAEVQRLEALLSFHRPDSEVSRINAAAGRAPAGVGPETFAAVEAALRFSALTGGAFDPAGGWRDVRLDPAARTVFLAEPGRRLDLGGLGKGFALDRALERAVSEPGLERVFMDFGGQLRFWSPSGSFPPERVAIEDPRGDGFLEVFEVGENGSVSTSSQGERPGHLVDPRTGRAADGALSVTVVAPTGVEAEAWSTALFVDPASAADARSCAGVRAFVHR